MDLIDPSKLPLKSATKGDCKEELTALRWHDSGFRCPSCGNDKAYWLRKRELYECANKQCKKQTSPTAGTQFQGLRKLSELWEFMRIQRMDENVSSGLVKEKTGLSYKSSRKMIERLEYCRRWEQTHAKFKDRQKNSNSGTQNSSAKYVPETEVRSRHNQNAAIFRTSHRFVSTNSAKLVHISFYFARVRQSLHVVKAI